MAASDLQDRLEYLVSYSSQLMFISSDVARQSTILDAFIAQSQDKVEVALISAATTTPLAKYREKLFRQLISQNKSADFNQPLNQLLAQLNHHDGPIIISITKAENLPNKLVKELWELVLQSRFTKNKQHLNILLFAQESWARQAQQTLSSKSGDKPVLINSSTSVQSLQHEMSTDLDKLIALKRKNFAKHVQQRTEKQRVQPTFLKRKSVIFSFVAVFIALFFTILSWQYPLELNAILKQLQAPKESAVAQSVSLPLATETLDVAPQIAEIQQDTINLTELASFAGPADTLMQQTLPSSEADPLVSDWHTAIAQVEKDSAEFLQNKAAQTLENIKLETALLSIQAAAQSELKMLNENTDTSQQNHTIEPSLSPIPHEIVGKEGIYLIQILAMSSKTNLPTQVPAEPLWHYETQRFGGSWHVLLYPQSYPSLTAAKAAIDKLPAILLAPSPFVKSATAIQREMSAKP